MRKSCLNLVSQYWSMSCCVVVTNTVLVGEECVDGEESGTVTPVPSARAARRKTDLVPTLPSPRDLTPRPMRSPGRAYSMSRLDILAQPRKPRTAPVVETTSERDPALSRSMTHLAGRPQRLRRTDTSRSMVQLSGPPVPPPRATRAERLRRKAREAANIRAESVPTSPGTLTPCHTLHLKLIRQSIYGSFGK